MKCEKCQDTFVVEIQDTNPKLRHPFTTKAPCGVCQTEYNPHILFISPYESQTNNWECLQFASEGAAIAHAQNCDLTKEYYICPIASVVELLREKFDELDG